MKSEDILYSIGWVKDAYIEEMMQPVQSAKIHKRVGKWRWLIAALISLLLLSGCAVLYMMSLDGLILGKESYTDDTTGKTEEISLLSLQGFAGSPNYQAAKEWMDFLNSYDTDKSIYHSLSNEEIDSFNDEYYSYTCYTDEMAHKIDEICEKYGLQRQGVPQHEQSWENICHVLQVNDLINETSGIRIKDGVGYLYRSGTFSLEADIALPQSEEWNPFDIYCAAKTDFDDVYMAIGAIGSYEQWNYTRTDGIEVLIAMQPDNVLIFADNTNYFLKASLTAASESGLNQESAEQLAESLNLSFTLKNVGDEAWKYLENHKIERRELLPPGTYKNGTYDERVRFHLENKPNPEELEYALADIDGNGNSDLLIGRNGIIRHVYMTDGTDTLEKPFNPIMRNIKMSDYGSPDFTNAPSYISICEGNKALYVYEETDGSISYMIAGVVDGEMIWTDILREVPAENAYYSLDVKLYGESPISKEEFQEKLNSCIPVEIEMTPISQYPFADR